MASSSQLVSDEDKKTMKTFVEEFIRLFPGLTAVPTAPLIPEGVDPITYRFCHINRGLAMPDRKDRTAALSKMPNIKAGLKLFEKCPRPPDRPPSKFDEVIDAALRNIDQWSYAEKIISTEAGGGEGNGANGSDGPVSYGGYPLDFAAITAAGLKLNLGTLIETINKAWVNHQTSLTSLSEIAKEREAWGQDGLALKTFQDGVAETTTSVAALSDAVLELVEKLRMWYTHFENQQDPRPELMGELADAIGNLLRRNNEDMGTFNALILVNAGRSDEEIQILLEEATAAADERWVIIREAMEETQDKRLALLETRLSKEMDDVAAETAAEMQNVGQMVLEGDAEVRAHLAEEITQLKEELDKKIGSFVDKKIEAARERRGEERRGDMDDVERQALEAQINEKYEEMAAKMATELKTERDSLIELIEQGKEEAVGDSLANREQLVELEDRLEAARFELEDRLEAARTEMVEGERRRRGRDRDAANARVDAANARVDALEKQKDQMELQIDADRASTASVKGQADALTKDMGAAEARVQVLEGKIQLLEGQRNENMVEAEAKFNGALQDHSDAVNQKVEELKVAIDAVAAEGRSHTDKVESSLRPRIYDAEQRSAQLQKSLNEFKNTQAELKQQILMIHMPASADRHGTGLHFTASGGGPRFYHRGGGGDKLLINFENGISIGFKNSGFSNYSELIKHYLMIDKNELIKESSNEISDQIHNYLIGDIELRYGPDEKILYKRDSCSAAYNDYVTAGGPKKHTMLPTKCYIEKKELSDLPMVFKFVTPLMKDWEGKIEIRGFGGDDWVLVQEWNQTLTSTLLESAKGVLTPLLTSQSDDKTRVDAFLGTAGTNGAKDAIERIWQNPWRGAPHAEVLVFLEDLEMRQKKEPPVILTEKLPLRTNINILKRIIKNEVDIKSLEGRVKLLEGSVTALRQMDNTYYGGIQTAKVAYLEKLDERADLDSDKNGDAAIKDADEKLRAANATYKSLLDEFPIISYFRGDGDEGYFYINQKSIASDLRIELDSETDPAVSKVFIKDEEIKEDVVHCYRDDYFHNFQIGFNAQRIANRKNIYNVDFEQAQRNTPGPSDPAKLFEYLRDELFYKTYSEELRTYLKSEKEQLMEAEWTANFTGLFHEIGSFTTNYGEQEHSYYILKGGGNSSIYRTYSEFIKKAVDAFTEKVEWLNGQIKICNESGKNKMEDVYDTAEKYGMPKEKIDQARGNKDEYDTVIGKLNDYRKTIGLAPFNEIETPDLLKETREDYPSDEGGDPGDGELDSISISNLNAVLSYTKGILNKSKTSESSNELMDTSRVIQDFTNNTEFNKFLLMSKQSLANRQPAEPINEGELAEDSPILVEQTYKTLYLKIKSNDGEEMKTKTIPRTTVARVAPPNSIKLDYLANATHKFFINDTELVMCVRPGELDKYRLGMNVRFNKTINIGKIKKINKIGEGYLEYSSEDDLSGNCKPFTGDLLEHLVIGVEPGISKLMEHVVDCKSDSVKPFTGFYPPSESHRLNIKLSETPIPPPKPNFYSLVFNNTRLKDELFIFSMDSSFNLYKDSPKLSYGPVLDEEKKVLYENLLTNIFGTFGLEWKETFTLEGMKYSEHREQGKTPVKGFNLSLIASGSTSTAIPKVKVIEKTIIDASHHDSTSDKYNKSVTIGEGLTVSARDETFSRGSSGVKGRKRIPGLKSKILKSALGGLALGVAAVSAPPLVATGLGLYGAKKLSNSQSKKTTIEPGKGFGQTGGADSSWTSSDLTSREKKSLERLKKSLDYSFNSETENNKDLKEDVIMNESLKSKIKEDILEIIGEVSDNPTTPESTDSKTKELEDRLKNLIEQQSNSKSAADNTALSREINSLRSQLSSQQRPQQQQQQQRSQQQQQPQQQRPQQQQQRSQQQQPEPQQRQPGQQPGQQPGEKPGEKPEQSEDKPVESPSFLDRFLGSSDNELEKEKANLEKDKADFERQKQDLTKRKSTKERMKQLKEEEVIQTDLFKQLPDKSSPEYERVKKMMIAQIKLIHKYNLLKQESFKLMVENSKCEKLEEENKEQKEQIKDQENKIFNIIQQILGSKGSNKGLNKLNKDLLGYIDDLKSNNPDGSLVDTGKYLELMNSSENSYKSKTLKKHKQPVNNKKKKTPKKNNSKNSPMKYIKKRTPKKPKFKGAKKGRRTPNKPKK